MPEFTATFNPEQFLDRLRGVVQLIRRGATEGERTGAKLALTRLIQRAKQEIDKMRQEGASHQKVDRFRDLVQQIANNTALEPDSKPRYSRPEEPRRPEANAVPKFKVGEWLTHPIRKRTGKVDRILRSENSIYYEFIIDGRKTIYEEVNLRKATQDEIDAAGPKPKIEQPNITEMARYINQRENSDKVYGIVKWKGDTYTFWGGYKKSLAVKKHDIDQAIRQFETKIAKGYVEMSNQEYLSAKDWALEALVARFAKSGV